MATKNKLPGLLPRLHTAAERGLLRFSNHALERMAERAILRLEVEYILKSGHHEKRKDSFDEEFNSWNYAIRGKTQDDRNLRIVVSFEKPNFVVITAIDLER